MSKETRKQIIENTRKECARAYTAKIKSLEERLHQANECSYQFMRAYNEANQKVAELEEKINQYEDWIERLQSFMDLSPEEREKEFATMKANQFITEKLESMVGTYSKLFHLI